MHERHGCSGIPLYNLWTQIRDRCTHPASKHYNRYGGRGIRVAEQWDSSFECFMADILADIGPKPSPDYSLDRIDNDKGYEPGNVRWATRFDQANNTRRNIYLTASGETKSIAQWARETGIAWTTISGRQRKGLSPEQCLGREDLPITDRVLAAKKGLETRLALGIIRSDARLVTAFGETKTTAEWSRQIGISRSCIALRLDRGLSPEQALGKDHLPSPGRTPKVYITAFGESKSISQWSKETGVSTVNIWSRLRKGYSPEECLSKAPLPHPGWRKKSKFAIAMQREKEQVESQGATK